MFSWEFVCLRTYTICPAARTPGKVPPCVRGLIASAGWLLDVSNCCRATVPPSQSHAEQTEYSKATKRSTILAAPELSSSFSSQCHATANTAGALVCWWWAGPQHATCPSCSTARHHVQRTALPDATSSIMATPEFKPSSSRAGGSSPAQCWAGASDRDATGRMAPGSPHQQLIC